MPLEKKFRLPKEIPMEEYPRPEVFLEEARRLIEGAQKQGIILRVMGPIALHLYFPQYVPLYQRMERLGERVFTDIDYASYGKYRGKIVPFFQSYGYEIEKRAAMISGNTRHIYFGGAVPMVDVFFDALSYNHPISFKDRLECHSQCISLADLLLQKLQIVQINDKDLKDAMLLLLAATLGEDDHDAINCRYIAKRMSDDWGFYYTATTNLKKIKDATASVAALDDQQRAIICDKADQVIQRIEVAPKTGNWQRRAKVGTAKPWYNLVEDWG
ncbi:MAG TPA: hypothetical protein VMS73_07885 [Anaerolineaceae bacterium]|nr:hypothetical protein [Anaerolineaceae bacterium]